MVVLQFVVDSHFVLLISANQYDWPFNLVQSFTFDSSILFTKLDLRELGLFFVGYDQVHELSFHNKWKLHIRSLARHISFDF